MSQRITPVQMVEVDYDCDECGEPMRPHGKTDWLAEPIVYQHKCANGHEATFPIRYPATGHIPIGAAPKS